MLKRITVRRGRKPSITTAAAQVQIFRRSLKSMVTEVGRLEARLQDLDRYYSEVTAKNGTRRNGAKTAPSVQREGPSVRDLAADILRRTRKPLPIRDLAAEVAKMRKNKVGGYFVQNLGIAINTDKRFKRVGRGLYQLRK